MLSYSEGKNKGPLINLTKLSIFSNLSDVSETWDLLLCQGRLCLLQCPSNNTCSSNRDCIIYCGFVCGRTKLNEYINYSAPGIKKQAKEHCCFFFFFILSGVGFFDRMS